MLGTTVSLSSCNTFRYSLITANQILKSAERCIGAVAHGDDDLLEYNVADIASCKKSHHTGFTFAVGYDFAKLVKFDQVFDGIAVRQKTDLNKHSIEFEFLFGSSGSVHITKLIYFHSIAIYSLRLRICNESDVGHGTRLLHQDAVCFQRRS